jgi:hypothetical protein
MVYLIQPERHLEIAKRRARLSNNTRICDFINQLAHCFSTKKKKTDSGVKILRQM